MAKAKISQINSHVIPSMEQQLKLKAYSSSTIKTYVNELSQLLQTIGKVPAEKLTIDDLRRYMVYCYEKLQLSENCGH